MNILGRCRLGAAWLLLCCVGAAGAADGRSGEQVFRQVCFACHESGVAHAPKFGDRQAWAPLIAEGQAILTAHAWVGVRAMPAKGGSPDLTLQEFARGVAFMSREAGSDWQDPDPALMRKIMLEAEKRLKQSIREAQAMQRELHHLLQRPAPAVR